jgi:hypothetical protein
MPREGIKGDGEARVIVLRAIIGEAVFRFVVVCDEKQVDVRKGPQLIFDCAYLSRDR